MINNNKLNLLMLGTAILYIASIGFTPYPGQFLIKVVPILLLTLFAYNNLSGPLKKITVIALLFSGTGDVLLALNFSNHFIFGLASFLLAQLTYSWIFFQNRNNNKTKLKPLVAVMIIGYALVMSQLITPQQPEMVIAVYAYLIVISGMALTATLAWHNSALHLIGALTFVASDSLIAWNMFVESIPYANIYIMLTYYAAQWMIINGIIKFQKTSVIP